MSGHTPGPWLTNGYSSPITGAITVYHKPFGLGDIAEVHDIADARLIAAAPDLLAALRFIMAFYEPGQSYLDTNAWKQAESSARAAIAKAEGAPS